jgi:two-component system LytT family response regulator
MSVRVLIVDDEPLARKRIRRLLGSEPDIAVVGECGSGREAIEAIQELSPDLVFLDIQMPGIGGFEVLQSIPAEHMPAIIFVTAYDEHAVRAFEFHALDYLLKPFKQDRFRKSVERARAQLAKGDTSEAEPGLVALLDSIQTERKLLHRFMIKTADRVVFIRADEVDWIESAANYALLHVADKTHLVRETMQALEAKLCPKTFQRVSRSAIVNLERIKELQPMNKGQYIIILSTGHRLTMTRGIRDLQQALDPR